MNKNILGTDEGSSELLTELSGCGYYSCKELAEMGLPDYPGTERGWLKLVERKQWPWREARAKGGKAGVKRLYQPPPTVLALIRGRLLSKSFNQYRMTVAVGKPLQTAISEFVDDYNAAHGMASTVEDLSTITEADVNAARGLSGLKDAARISYQAPYSSWRGRMTEPWVPAAMADVAVRAIMAINELPEIPRTISSSRRAALVVRVFELLMAAADGNQPRLLAIIDKPETFLGALRLAWEAEPKDN